ncbi:MAG: DNA alkylation repair protein [Nanoarchaeota archaeon]|nr:DNA alkylation repair protein [Nanoarchaeota archaeon]
MVYKSKKKLKKLSDEEFADDVKKYISSSHTFYSVKLPELKILAKRLHEEYDLKSFYKVFNKFWRSGYNEERSLAIYALELYKEEFDFNTWKFLKPKLKEIKSWDKIDSVAVNIIGEIILRSKQAELEIIKIANTNNLWFKRLAIMSTIPMIKKKKIGLSLKLAKKFLNEKEEYIQNATGWILKEIGEENPDVLKRFVLKNINMPIATFNYATENMKELRKMKDIKKLEKKRVLGFNAIKDIFRR